MIAESLQTISLANYLAAAHSRLEKLSNAISPEATTVVALMVIFQYGGIIRSASSGLGSYQSIPLTVLILSALAVIFVISRSSVLRQKTRPWFGLITIPIVALWVSTTVWAYLFGSLIVFPSPIIGLATLVIAATLISVGFITKRLWMVCTTLAGFCAVVTFFHIQANQFLLTFLPGRPLWVIQSAVLNVHDGKWPYVYNDFHSLSYFPFLAIPYLPFGWLHIDLRWANFVGAVIFLSSLWFAGRKFWHSQRVIIMVVVFFSPVFLYEVITTQLSFYWVYLLWMILAASCATLSIQRSTLLLACFSRQLAWPLALPWIVYWALRNRQKKDERQSSIDWSFLKLRSWEILCVIMVVGIVLFDLKSFYWSTFVYALNDGYQAAASGIIQPAKGIALTPLLPFATNPTLVLLFAAGLIIVLTTWLTRTKLLFRSLSLCLIIIYVSVLSFAFMIHDYYWIDIIVMTLAYLWSEARIGGRTSHQLSIQ